MYRVIKSASNADTIYEVIVEKSSKDRNGYARYNRPQIITGNLEDQINALSQHYDYWGKEYKKAYGQDLDFSKITTIEKVLTAYRQIDKACKQSNPSFFNVKKKYSYKRK